MKSKRKVSSEKNQTQTSVYNYYSHRRPDDRKASPSSSSPWKRLKKTPLTKLIIIILAVCVIGFLLTISSRSIIRTESSQRPVHDISVYRASADELIQSSIFNRTKLSFNYSGFSQAMKSKYPELKSVTTSFDIFGRRPVVSLQFYEPKFRVFSRGLYWAVDERGVAVAQVNKDADEKISTLPLITDNIGLITKAGDQLMSPSDSRYISTVQGLLSEKGISVQSTTIPLVPRELDIVLSGETITYKFSLDESARAQAGTLISTRETLRAKNEAPSEYVDLRAGEKYIGASPYSTRLFVKCSH